MIRKLIAHSTKLSSLLRSPDSPLPYQAQECVTWLGSLRALRPWTIVVLLVALVVAGCGPSREESRSADLADVTKDIAYTYAEDRNLPTAQAALDALDVANANQWLVLVAEQTIAEGPNGDADALTMLSTDLGLTSAIVARYAEQRGFTSAAPPAPENPQSVQQTPPTPSANVAQNLAQAVPATVVPDQNQTTEEPASSTAEVLPAETPTPVSEQEAPTPVATDVAVQEQLAQVQAVSPMNVRAGPSTEHPIVGAMQAGTLAAILAKNSAGDWWQVNLLDGSVGWIFAPLVEAVGNVGEVSVAAAIPTAPPVPPTATPAPTQAPQPETVAPVEAPPADQPPADQPPASAGGYSVVTRLRPVGQDAQSCGGGENSIFATVLDAAGNPINGVRVIEVFSGQVRETGQKGPGLAQWDIYRGGGGQLQIVDGAGSPLSPPSAGMSADWPAFEMMRDAGYCDCKPHTDLASCQRDLETKQYLFAVGHYTYEVIFRQN
ncbi:SH3 domain-containing protein [bacterium]|nr:SH3 domain-containing protein [bacterium]